MSEQFCNKIPQLHYQQETNVSAKGKDIQRKEKQKSQDTQVVYLDKNYPPAEIKTTIEEIKNFTKDK